MKTRLVILALSLAPLAVAAAPPGILNQQGRITVNGSNFGSPTPQSGHFKFALIDAGANILWSNTPDAAPADGEPDVAVPVTVTKGHYAVGLGDTSLTNMDSAVPSSLFADQDEVSLRIWFSTSESGPFEQLTPDRRITSTGYALAAEHAETAATADSLASSDLVGLTSLGIGTTSPTGTLDVIGNIVSRGSAGGAVRVNNPQNQGASVNLGWLSDVARLRIGGTGAGAQNGFDIQTVSDRSLLRITGTGDVGINTADEASG